MATGDIVQRLEVLNGTRDPADVTPSNGAICQQLDILIEQGIGGGITEEEAQALIDAAIAAIDNADLSVTVRTDANTGTTTTYDGSTARQLNISTPFSFISNKGNLWMSATYASTDWAGLNYFDETALLSVITAGQVPDLSIPNLAYDGTYIKYGSQQATFTQKTKLESGFATLINQRVGDATLAQQVEDNATVLYYVDQGIIFFATWIDGSNVKHTIFLDRYKGSGSVEFYVDDPLITSYTTLTGVATTNPTQNPHIANKQYVDNAIDTKFGEIVNASY